MYASKIKGKNGTTPAFEHSSTKNEYSWSGNENSFSLFLSPPYYS